VNMRAGKQTTSF